MGRAPGSPGAGAEATRGAALPGEQPHGDPQHPAHRHKRQGHADPLAAALNALSHMTGAFRKPHAMPLKQVHTGERKTVPHQGQTFSTTSQKCLFFFFFFLRLFIHLGFPGGSAAKNPPANAGDKGSIPESGRSPGEGNGNPLQYSCLRNPMDRGDWWATVHRVAKSAT